MLEGVAAMVMRAGLAAGLGLSAAAAPSPSPSPVAAPPARPAPAPRLAPAASPSRTRDAAPRPTAEVRVQNRYATKARLWQAYGGFDYLSRGDFYISPGARIGATYYVFEPLGLEVQASHFWSSLDDEAQRVLKTLGALPDSHAPTWLALAGARYSIGYGKLMVGGVGGVIHFEPQAFLHAGIHDHDGDVGPSADAGLGFLFFLTPRAFARVDAAVVYERETRSGQGVSVWGFLPGLSVGGTL